MAKDFADLPEKEDLVGMHHVRVAALLLEVLEDRKNQQFTLRDILDKYLDAKYEGWNNELSFGATYGPIQRHLMKALHHLENELKIIRHPDDTDPDMRCLS